MRGQQRRRAGNAADVIAFRQKRAAHAAIDRRPHLGVFQIELGRVARRFRRQQGRFGFLEPRHARVGFLG